MRGTCGERSCLSWYGKSRAKQILKRHSQSVSGRAIAGSLGISRSSVAETLGAAADAGVSYADIASKSDDEVCALLFPGRNEHASACRQPDWEAVHLRAGEDRRHVEAAACRVPGFLPVRRVAVDGLRPFLQAVSVVCGGQRRHVEGGAQGRFDDRGGLGRADIGDRGSGDRGERDRLPVRGVPAVRPVRIRGACAGYGETTWLRCHVAMYEWLGGSTPAAGADNLKTGVTAHPREGEIVPDERYRALADHYSAAVLPGRVKRPRDKASVENTVWHATMAVIGAMRNRTFRSCI